MWCKIIRKINEWTEDKHHRQYYWSMYFVKSYRFGDNHRNYWTTVDYDATINLGGASSDSGIDDSIPNDATNNTGDNNDTAINKSNDATAALKLLCLNLVISAKGKCDDCVSWLTWFNRGKLENEKISCVNGECPTCGFDKIFSKGLWMRILIR